MVWKNLGGGKYNITYISEDGMYVLKVSRDSLQKTDLPKRSVELWKLINPNLPAETVTATVKDSWGHNKDVIGWQCAYVEGRQANDAEMSNALIDIFNKTGRIIIDATGEKNFITTPAGEVVCIDIALAIQLEERDDAYLKTLSRSRSTVSLKAWEDLCFLHMPHRTLLNIPKQ